MQRERIARAVGLGLAVLVATALTGCVPDRPGDAADWLRSQAGVVSAEVIADHSGEFQSSGISRGELADGLADGLSDDGLATLVKSVEGYLSTHDQVSIRLGRDGIDFTVSIDTVLAALDRLGTDVSLEALGEAAAIADDTERDAFFDDGI